MLDQCMSVTTPVVVDPRLTALYRDSANLVGIDAQKNELVNWAMDKGKQLKVMSIVGCGGLGKTTLANEVYHEVGDKFDCKSFISVSQKPEMIGLLNNMLSQLQQDKKSHACQEQYTINNLSHACQVQDLINNLRVHLRDKR
jgi:translation initiation factor RLI1